MATTPTTVKLPQPIISLRSFSCPAKFANSKKPTLERNSICVSWPNVNRLTRRCKPSSEWRSHQIPNEFLFHLQIGNSIQFTEQIHMDARNWDRFTLQKPLVHTKASLFNHSEFVQCRLTIYISIVYISRCWHIHFIWTINCWNNSLQTQVSPRRDQRCGLTRVTWLFAQCFRLSERMSSQVIIDLCDRTACFGSSRDHSILKLDIESSTLVTW